MRFKNKVEGFIEKTSELFKERGLAEEYISFYLFYNEFYGEAEELHNKLLVVQGLKFENVDQHGGEGEGDEYWNVYKFEDVATGEVAHVKVYGWYQSYSGAEYNNWGFVEPVERMVTFYE